MSGITLGIEEELMIVDPRSRDVVADPDEGIMAKASETSDGQRVPAVADRHQLGCAGRSARSRAVSWRSFPLHPM